MGRVEEMTLRRIFCDTSRAVNGALCGAAVYVAFRVVVG